MLFLQSAYKPWIWLCRSASAVRLLPQLPLYYVIWFYNIKLRLENLQKMLKVRIYYYYIYIRLVLYYRAMSMGKLEIVT